MAVNSILPGDSPAMATKTVTDQSFASRRPGRRRAGAGRFLGRMVRAVPDDRPGARGNRQRPRRQGHGRQAQHRRESGYSWPLRRARNPDDAAVQGRPAGRAEGRRGAAQPDPAVAGEQARHRSQAKPARRSSGGSVPSSPRVSGRNLLMPGKIVASVRTSRSCCPRRCEIRARTASGSSRVATLKSTVSGW